MGKTPRKGKTTWNHTQLTLLEPDGEGARYQTRHTKAGKLNDTPVGLEHWSDECDNITTYSKDNLVLLIWRKKTKNIDLQF